MKERGNFYLYFGIWIAVLPFIGVPGIWKTYLICISGLIIVFHASLPFLIKRLQAKAPRPRKKPAKRTDITETPQDLRFNEPELSKNNEPASDGDNSV